VADLPTDVIETDHWCLNMEIAGRSYSM